MDWTQAVVIIAANLAVTVPLWLWNRTEANADRREISAVLRELKEEMKDFHGRLCAIEERYRSNK